VDAVTNKDQMANMNKWDCWYGDLDPSRPESFGDPFTYSLGAKFLESCATIEDWGCGKGGFRPWCPPNARYIGIDGSATPFADRTADLALYRSRTEGIFMRHVLEHDERWARVLCNAAASFSSKMVLVTFTPEAPSTHVIAITDDIGVPDIAFRRHDLLEILENHGVMVVVETHRTETQYGVEQVFYCWKVREGLNG
jgi:hypothetical protein